MDNENGRALPEVQIPNLKKEKEKKTAGVPISGGGAARSAATALAKVAARQGADAAARGFLPNLLAALAGKTAVVATALAVGGGAVGLSLVARHAGQNASAQRGANLSPINASKAAGLAGAAAAIHSTIAVSRDQSSASLKYAARAGRDELNGSSSGESLGGDQKAEAGKTTAAEGAGNVAQNASGNSAPVPGAGGGAEAGAVEGGPADQMAHDLSGAKLSSSLGGSGNAAASGAKVLFNDGGAGAAGADKKKLGQLEAYNYAAKQGAAGGKMYASHNMQASYNFAKGPNGRAGFGKSAQRLGAMRNFMNKPGTGGVAENQVQNMVESWDSTALKGAGVVHPDKMPGAPTLTPQGGGGASPNTTLSFCTKQGDQYVDYFDNGKGDGGCIAKPKAEVDQWHKAVADINRDIGSVLILSIIGMAMSVIAFAFAKQAAEIASACSGGWGGFAVAAACVAAVGALVMTFIQDCQKLKQAADMIKSMPGSGHLGDEIGKMVDFIQYTVYAATAVCLAVIFIPWGGSSIAIVHASALVAAVGNGVIFTKIMGTKNTIKNQGNDALGNVDQHVAEDEAAANSRPQTLSAQTHPHTNT